MILSSFGLPQNATISNWLKAADDLNKNRRKNKKAGIQMATIITTWNLGKLMYPYLR